MIDPYFFCELCETKHSLVDVVDCIHGKDQSSWDKYNEFNKCPACSGSHFYRQKDFNRLLGCGIIFFGVLVPIVLNGFIWRTIIIQSTQSATGLLYVSVVAVIFGDLFYKNYTFQFGLIL